MTAQLTGEALATAALNRYGEILGLMRILERALALRRKLSPDVKTKIETAVAMLKTYREELEASGLLPPDPAPRGGENVH